MSKRLIITIGDATGIGPEITAKYLANYPLPTHVETLVFGDITALLKTAEKLKLSLPKDIIYSSTEMSTVGETSYKAICEAYKLAMQAPEHTAIVTGPISKARLMQAGLDYSGHTEIFADLLNRDLVYTAPEMLFAYKNFRMLLLTRHETLFDVPNLLSADKITEQCRTLYQFLRHVLKINMPKVGMLALNPHAGEIGGDEENILLDAQRSINTQLNYPFLSEPLAADAALRKLDPENPAYDCYIACYHDQGLIPIKLLGGFEAVNISIGMPFIRTSVSHGTAEDILNQDCADEKGLFYAVETALALILPSDKAASQVDYKPGRKYSEAILGRS